MSVSWKIPSMSLYTRTLLCCGYISRYCNIYVIPPIISLITTFYTNDEYSINDIKNAVSGQCFHSPMFVIGDLKFYLEIFPNGLKSSSEGKVMIYLCLATKSPKIDCVFAMFKLFIKETDTKYIRDTMTSFNHRDSSSWYSGWNFNLLQLDQLKSLNTFTVNLTINIWAVKKKHDDVHLPMTNIYKTQSAHYLNASIMRYQWKIKDATMIHRIRNAPNAQSFWSKPFEIRLNSNSLKWRVKFHPNGHNSHRVNTVCFFLKLLHFPSNISQITVKYTLSILETNTSHSLLHYFTAKYPSWGKPNLLSTDILRKLNQITIHIDISIIDIYDDNGNELILPQTNTNIIQLPTEEYLWTINEKQTIDSIHSVTTKHHNIIAFYSPIFELHGLKWYISFYPNGSRISRKGQINLYVNLLSFPLSNISYEISFVLLFIETGDSYHGSGMFNPLDACNGSSNWSIQTDDIVDLDTFTFNIEICILNVYQNNEIITNKHQLNKYKTIGIQKPKLLNNAMQDTFTWIIPANNHNKMSLIGEGIKSESFVIFGMIWSLKVFPNGKYENEEGYFNLSIYNESFQSDSDYKENLKQISELIDWGYSERESICGIKLSLYDIQQKTNDFISIRYVIEIPEIDMMFVRGTRFSNDWFVESWGKDRIKTEQFHSMKQFTIKLKMELIDGCDNKFNKHLMKLTV